MLYALLLPLGKQFIGFNVFRYITFRTGLALATAFFLSLVVGPWLVNRLRALQIRQEIREEGPEHHQVKAGTPTMGGLLIVGSIALTTLLWADLGNLYVWTVLGVSLGFAAIGFTDDWIKVRRRRNLGLTARQKILLQALVGLAGGLAAKAIAAPAPHAGALALPFVKDLLLPLGLAYLPFVMIVMLGSSNAVNLTDGLDGLAVGAMAIAAGTYTVFVYIAGHLRFAEYLRVVAVSGAGEVAVFTGAITGAALGFLWFNCHPAQVFMGDVGSLALGGGIGIVAVVAKQELLLMLVGGLFVLEALSVLIQVGSYKLRRKRVFRMAPLHHHFELAGWTETQVVVRFWIISVVFALAGLATLKLR
ncbi:MAG TPA: phospho-N-acetylmuramoyl-pentapeptide-transferase [Thermoanaerobaculales bacterium]|nr:phospho-N-acetylmuramoyl-pentapeptide-transferase [Thermoanaerobaculales bacterium]HQL30049.1 phospho-N-acetylmuramoyl-pentapeptide-transferase [Thermoanaerobaculales bacterium]HQP45023.1 phospho-N-acetylmuramoyl-pentapeptide-transferase [Thermoanaerobaculales bacterium]